ncbi:retrovirus-related pol polyprotein from transposon TNT 1-94 [Tanacetum coccineum]
MPAVTGATTGPSVNGGQRRQSTVDNGGEPPPDHRSTTGQRWLTASQQAGQHISGSFKNSGRSDEEDSKDRASSEEGGSETPQLRRSTRESKDPWKKAINEEIVSLEKNHTWSLVRLPAGKKALQSKWVFRVKEEQDGKKRYKARLVFKGFQQKQGVDYNKIFSPVVKMTTIRLVLSIVAAENLHLEQLDVKTAFLHGDLNEDIYMTQLEETRCQPLGDHFKLSKKQAPKTEASRRRMAKDPYVSAVGSVMYTMVCTRPDIAHAVGVVSRFMSNPGREHWEAVKWLLRYLKGTSKATLCFSRKEVVLEGFSDSDYGGCLDSGKSTTGYVFTMGGTSVSWMSKIQKCVAMSTTEAEYMAIAEAGKELVWNFLKELDRAQTEWTLSLKKILGAKNPADMLTKVVTTEKLKLCAASTGLQDN